MLVKESSESLRRGVVGVAIFSSRFSGQNVTHVAFQHDITYTCVFYLFRSSIDIGKLSISVILVRLDSTRSETLGKNLDESQYTAKNIDVFSN